MRWPDKNVNQKFTTNIRYKCQKNNMNDFKNHIQSTVIVLKLLTTIILTPGFFYLWLFTILQPVHQTTKSENANFDFNTISFQLILIETPY